MCSTWGRIHEVWTRRRCSYQGVAHTPRYKHTDVFLPFPFPEGSQLNLPPQTWAQHPQAAAITEAASNLLTVRENWLNPPELVLRIADVLPGYPERIVAKDEAVARVLKERTMTKLYNERPAWLEAAHRKLDAPVAEAYGLSETAADDAILDHLFNLNQKRGAEQYDLASSSDTDKDED